MKIRIIRTLLLIIVIGILSSPVIGQNKRDVYNYEQKGIEIKQLNAKIDSLISINRKFAEETNYFSTALSSQTSIFSIIIAVIVSFIGLASYLNFRWSISKYKKEILIEMDKCNSKISKIESSTTENQKLVYKALGNLNVLISKIYKDNHDSVVIYLIQGAKFQYFNGVIPAALQNLSKAKKELDDFGLSDQFRKYEVIIKELQVLIRSDNEKIAYVSSKIFCKILECKASNNEKKSSK